MSSPLSDHQQQQQQQQLMVSYSSPARQSFSRCNRKLLPPTHLRHWHDRDSGAGPYTPEPSSVREKNASMDIANFAAASASGLPRPAVVAAAPPSMEPFRAATGETLETAVLCDNANTQAVLSSEAFPAAAIIPTAAAQPPESVVISPSIGSVSLESSSSVNTLVSLSCVAKPLIPAAVMPREEECTMWPPAAAASLQATYLERHLNDPYKGAKAMVTFDRATTPFRPSPLASWTVQSGSAATTITAPPLSHGTSRLSPAAGAGTPVNAHVGRFPYLAAAPVAETAATTCTVVSTDKGVASSSAALTADSPDYSSMNGSLIPDASTAPASEHVPQQQQQQQSPSRRSRASESFVIAAASTYPTVAAAPVAPSGSSKIQSSCLLSQTQAPAAAKSRASASVDGSDIDRTSPQRITPVAPSLPASLSVSETLGEGACSAPAGHIDCVGVYETPTPSLACAKPDAMRPGSPESFSPVATTERAGVVMDVVGYLECELDTRWCTLARFVAALFLPHIFLWQAVAALLPQAAVNPAAEAAVPPRAHRYALALNHSKTVLFALEFSVAGIMLWSLVRYCQRSSLQRSRGHHSLYGGLHLNSTPLAISSGSAGVGPTSVSRARISVESCTAHLPTTTTTTKKKYVYNVELLSTSMKMAGMRLLSSLRELCLRSRRSLGAGGIGSGLNSCSVSGSSHAHRSLSHSPVPLLQLQRRPFAGVRNTATMAMGAATSGGAAAMRDLANVSACPSDSGGTMRLLGSRSVSGGIVSDITLGGRSNASSLTTPSLSHISMGLAIPTAEVMHSGFSDMQGYESLPTPGDAGSAIVTGSTAFEVEANRSEGSVSHGYPPRIPLWDMPRLPQQSRELLSGSGAGRHRDPPTTSADLHASPFTARGTTGHTSPALVGLGDRDSTLVKNATGAVSIQPSAGTLAAAASTVLTDSLLLSSSGAAATAPASATVHRDGHLPTMTYFGVGLGLLIGTGLATWRLSVDYHFARYSFTYGTNAALWFWLIPVCLLGIAAYVVLLIGGHTLRWRALRQLRETNARGCSRDEDNLEEATHERAAAALALCRLRWMPWCLACVPYPYPDLVPLLDLPESVLLQPEAAAMSSIGASGGSVAGALALDGADAVPPAMSRMYKERVFCDSGDDTVYDDEVSVAASDDTLDPVDDLLRVTRENTVPSTPAPETSSEVVNVTAATAFDNLKTMSLLATTPAAAADVNRSACDLLLYPRQALSRIFPTTMLSPSPAGRSRPSCRATSSHPASSSLWIVVQRLQRTLVVMCVLAMWSSWKEYASRALPTSGFLMRLRRSCSLAQQRRGEPTSRQRTRVAAPAERQLWSWCTGRHCSLERVLAWTYLLMLFLFSQALLSLMYFTWSWRCIIREAATAAMYATDTARATMPVSPSFVVYGCTTWQLSLRNALWVIPPLCVGGDASVSSPGSLARWSMENQVALLFTLLGQRRFQVAYLYTNVALPIGFVVSLCIFVHEVWIHIKSRRVLRLLALAKSQVKISRKMHDAML
ncbi:hypothetical protein LtaPh_0405000 [Leishmania tarentolae]|uniref:Uncharacterized protein n=1 Tax=Leishmania tarentolae TaxID=5689 RepID=A0A640KD38_LEITA|nr:hypothetical protein LtaPh_0405000 [Leishmania tarentolae]